MSANIHLKGVNGIRAIAALAVVVFHIVAGLKDFGFGYNLNFDLGPFGVTLFFALSGFLITYLLLVEKSRFGHINIKAFYLRRILRIWPLYYLYLILALITIYIFRTDPLPDGILYYVFLCANIPFIFQFPLSVLNHYWSLGVEEQFYIFWPWIVERSKHLLRFLCVFIIGFVIVKLALRYIDATTSWHWPYAFLSVTRFDCMAIGAIAAIFYFEKNQLFFRICQSVVAQLAAWASLVLLAFSKFHIASVLDAEIIAVMTVILIVNVSSNPRSLVKMENRYCDFLGRISYGIYVYHPLIIFYVAKTLKNWLVDMNEAMKLIVIFIIVFGLTILIAYLSYEFFEKRFLSLKSKFSPVKSVDSMKDNSNQPVASLLKAESK